MVVFLYCTVRRCTISCLDKHRCRGGQPAKTQADDWLELSLVRMWSLHPEVLAIIETRAG